ncbi:MAG: substrate-binding periplasmic protein [Thermodesulfobacteriota bacterium]
MAVLSWNSAHALTLLTEISPPSSCMRDGTLTGVGVEIVREMQRRVGDSSPIEVLPWARAYATALAMPDVAIFSTTRTPEREELFKWVGPILTSEWILAGIPGRSPAVSSLEDARRAGSIGTYKDDARERFLLDMGFANLDSAPDPMTSLRKLRAGRIDLMATTNLGLKVISDSAKPGDPPVRKVFAFNKVDLYVAFSRETASEAVLAWQNALDSMKADGTLRRIQSLWLDGGERAAD